MYISLDPSPAAPSKLPSDEETVVIERLRCTKGLRDLGLVSRTSVAKRSTALRVPAR